MSKERISATVDEDVHAYINQDHINTSGLVNELIREYMNAGGDKDAISQFRIRQLEDEAEDLSERAERKREKIEKLKEQQSTRESEKLSEQREQILQAAAKIPADPEHPFIVENAEKLGIDTEDLAREIADEHGKEYNPNSGDDDLRSV